ncbi:hypothetical protein [Planktotalea sp.]|uniref:hypothetical protein n=1 Tax=Planktotalea sp. TaxID=2029877 RepID=UPI003D6B3755
MYLKKFACAAVIASVASSVSAQNVFLDCSNPANATADACLAGNTTPTPPAPALANLGTTLGLGIVAVGIVGALGANKKNTSSTD